MSKQTLLSRVDELFKKYGKDLKVALSGEKKEMLASANTQEGVKVSTPADAFAAGVEVYVTDEAGNDVPAPNGEHVMEDGSVIVVQDGVITEVKAPEPAEEEMSAEDTAKVIEGLLTRVSDLEAKLSANEAELSAQKEAATSATAEATALRAENAKLKKAPAAKSVTEEKLAAAATKEEPKKSRTLEIIKQHSKN